MLPLLAHLLILLPASHDAPQAAALPSGRRSLPAAASPGIDPGTSVALPDKPKPSLCLSPVAPPANPYQRAIDLTVDIEFFARDLGEVALHMGKDGQVAVSSSGLLKAFTPLLNPAGMAKLAIALKSRSTIDPVQLQAIGIALHFDRAALLLQVTAIDPAMRIALPVYGAPNGRSTEEASASPAGFSAFLNASVLESRIWKGQNPRFQDPSLFLDSAIRAGPIVIEAQGQFADQTPTFSNRNYQFDRNFVRMVYDLPSKYTRIDLGDLTPDVRFQQNYVQMAGIGFSRERRRFDQFRSAILQGNRQLLLQRDATVDVYRNGVLFQQLQLAPGAYDLANLPLTAGSNDIRLAVHDASGLSQTIAYQTYLDPIDLDPGDYEAGGYFGKMATQFGLSPRYDGEYAFTGFYRKAFIGHPAVGFGLQASHSVQQLSTQTQFLVGWGARLDLTAAGSRSAMGNGFMAGLGFDLALDQGARSNSISVQATYQTRYFTGLGAPLQYNSERLSFAGTYTHTFGPNLSGQLGVTYGRNRAPLEDNYRLYAEGYYRLSRKWSVRGGIDYQKLGSYNATTSGQNGLGFSIGLILQPTARDRVEATYDTRLAATEASYEHSPDSYVGAVNYGAVLDRMPRQTSVQGSAGYLGDRFDASITHSLLGGTIGRVSDNQVTSLRIGTAIAFADGALALGRRINDSFAILVPHATLDGRSVISGQSLADDHYLSKSGKLGGAVDNFLSSYVTQTVQYDVENLPPGYDLGTGVFRLRPFYHSGYRLVIGTDSFVSAAGTLNDENGVAVAVTGGQVENVTHPEIAASPFFTNSVGRFAVTNLRLKSRYRVKLFSGRTFEFVVPDKIAGYLDLHVVKLGPAK